VNKPPQLQTLPFRGRVAAKPPGGAVRTTSRTLRKTPTDAERKMWWILRDLKWPKAHFRRQAQIGPFFADFVSHHFKLVIEIDGSQHYDPEGIARDTRRTAFLKREDFHVIRFGNREVLSNSAGVTDRVIFVLTRLDPTRPRAAANPPPEGEGLVDPELPELGPVTFDVLPQTLPRGGEGGERQRAGWGRKLNHA
jgi:very-short-patch-repair endonuclease